MKQTIQRYMYNYSYMDFWLTNTCSTILLQYHLTAVQSYGSTILLQCNLTAVQPYCSTILLKYNLTPPLNCLHTYLKSVSYRFFALLLFLHTLSNYLILNLDLHYRHGVDTSNALDILLMLCSNWLATWYFHDTFNE